MGSADEFLLILPELTLLGAAVCLLIYGVFQAKGTDAGITGLAVVFLGVALVLVLAIADDGIEVFENLLILDKFGQFMKALVLIGAILSLGMSYGYRERAGLMLFEYPVLILFATLGMLLMISANDMMSLYLAVELQSLPLYVIAAFDRDSQKSGEAGLKYFVLGALASGLLLYGCSLVYGFTGSTSFDGIAAALGSKNNLSVGLVVGMVFICSGLAFKVSAVPFHMWTPDVYEGAPTPVTAFFAAAPKVAAVALFVRVLFDPFSSMVSDWQQLIIAISIGSMLLGTFAAIYQTNFKRLMAYSSIGNIGFAFVGLAAGTEEGIQGVIIYMTIYLIMTIGSFGCILSMRVRGEMLESIDDLAGLGRTNPLMAGAIAIMMFSLAGIPPLAGFFGKLYVFLAAVHTGLYFLAIIGLLTSVVGAFYYLRVVKIIYFDEAKEIFDKPIGREVTVVVTISAVFILLFFVYPSPILIGAENAAAALFP